MVLIVKDAKRSNVCVEMECAHKFERFQLGTAACEGQRIISNLIHKFQSPSHSNMIEPVLYLAAS